MRARGLAMNITFGPGFVDGGGISKDVPENADQFTMQASALIGGLTLVDVIKNLGFACDREKAATSFQFRIRFDAVFTNADGVTTEKEFRGSVMLFPVPLDDNRRPLREMSAQLAEFFRQIAEVSPSLRERLTSVVGRLSS